MNHSFYTATAEWAYEMYQSQRVWLRRSLVMNLALLVLLAVSITTALMLFPLKEKVPYLYAFDHATGEITKIGSLESSTLETNWELSRYLIMRYVINRESYDLDNIDMPYQLVWAQSSAVVQQQYEESVKTDQQSSPYQLFGNDKFVTIKVVSINRLNDFTVDLKFEKIIHDRASLAEQVIPREAILKWSFEKAETSQKMLDRDPLGFKVTYYQSTQVNLDNNQVGK